MLIAPGHTPPEFYNASLTQPHSSEVKQLIDIVKIALVALEMSEDTGGLMTQLD